jgi:mRNA interferase RelE/StbE
MGYHLARMTYRITFAPEALDDFRALRAYDRARVRDAINTHLRNRPTRQSKSRIKRLRDMEKPRFRLRVGEIRDFYDVEGDEVAVLGIVAKSQAAEWLRKRGVES